MKRDDLRKTLENSNKELDSYLSDLDVDIDHMTTMRDEDSISESNLLTASLIDLRSEISNLKRNVVNDVEFSLRKVVETSSAKIKTDLDGFKKFFVEEIYKGFLNFLEESKSHQLVFKREVLKELFSYNDRLNEINGSLRDIISDVTALKKQVREEEIVRGISFLKDNIDTLQSKLEVVDGFLPIVSETERSMRKIADKLDFFDLEFRQKLKVVIEHVMGLHRNSDEIKHRLGGMEKGMSAYESVVQGLRSEMVSSRMKPMGASVSSSLTSHKTSSFSPPLPGSSIDAELSSLNQRTSVAGATPRDFSLANSLSSSKQNKIKGKLDEIEQKISKLTQSEK